MIKVKLKYNPNGWYPPYISYGKIYVVEELHYHNYMTMGIINDNKQKRFNEARCFEVIEGKDLYDKLVMKAYASDMAVSCIG